jgi:hypothetical protein
MSKKNRDWKNISITSDEFIEDSKHQNDLLQLLHEFFSINKEPNQNFICELSYEFPNELILAIRLNKVFLNEYHSHSIAFLKTHANAELQKHYWFTRYLTKQDTLLLQLFTNCLGECQSLQTLDVLCWISIWYEEKRAKLFEKPDTSGFQYDILPNIEVINFFLCHYFNDTKYNKSYDTLKAYNDVITLDNIKSEKPEILFQQAVWKALDAAANYLYFVDGLLYVYCFDLNFDITQQENNITLTFIDKNVLHKWYIDEAKVRYWYDYYRTLAKELYDYQLNENQTITKLNQNKYNAEMNEEGAIRKGIAHFIAEDFGVENSNLGLIKTPHLITALTGFIVNAWGRYVSPMDKLNAQNPNNWLNHTFENTLHFAKKSIHAGPTRLLSESEFIQTILNTSELNETQAKELIAMLSFDVESIKTINRFKLPLKINAKPFLKLGDFYFAFNGILGESNSQATIITSILESNNINQRQTRKEEVERLEAKVKDKFVKAGFLNSLHSINYYNKKEIAGDFDVVVYEEGFLLLIEMKRSKLRHNLEEIHDEFMLSTLTAAKQLDKANQYVSANFMACKTTVFKPLGIKEINSSELKIYTLIVSSTFEKDHERINNKHLKISLFELEFLLDEYFETTTSKLKLFMNRIESNEFWKQRLPNIKAPLPKNHTIQINLNDCL